MKEHNSWNILEKIFDNFPFRFLISAAMGGIIYAITPDNNSLLIKFGITWYIVFISLITFLVLSFLIWIVNIIKIIIKNKQYTKRQNDLDMQFLEKERKKLYEITDFWEQDDLDTLRDFITNRNQKLKVDGQPVYNGENCLFNSNILNKKTEYESTNYDPKTKNFNPMTSATTKIFTIYWLKEDYYQIIKAIYTVYKKLSNYDKGEDNK